MMNTICPKCKNENWDETITMDNNPNLITCKECKHVYFIELKLIYKKAYKHTNSGYSTVECGS